MPQIVVSGRMAILFDKVSLPIGGEGDEAVDGYRCRWCGFTYVGDDPKLIPDHACHGAAGAEGGRRERAR
jgi:hypothetical protein